MDFYKHVLKQKKIAFKDRLGTRLQASFSKTILNKW